MAMLLTVWACGGIALTILLAGTAGRLKRVASIRHD